MIRHRFDPLSFVFGAMFVLLAVVTLADARALRLVDLRLVGPAVLIVVGLTLLLSLGGRDRAASAEALGPQATDARDADPAPDADPASDVPKAPDVPDAIGDDQ